MKQTTLPLLATSDTWISGWFSPRHLLIAGAIFHLVVTMSIYGLGRYGLLPGTFDTNGIAVSFATDGIELREEAAKLSDDLTSGRIRDWLTANSPLHIKLYSICFGLLAPLFGSTILSAEPLNALCYLAILALTFSLGQEVFNRRAGLIAAVTVALWPSLLLHTTQLLKDPLFLVGMLAFILINVRLLSRNLSLPKALLTGGSGGLVAAFIWLVRDNMAGIMILSMATAAGLLIARQVREKHFQAANLVGMVLLILMIIGATRLIPKFRPPEMPMHTVETTGAEKSLERVGSATNPTSVASNPSTGFVRRVWNARQRFIDEYPDAGSNIDSQVELITTADILRFLPRATVIGFFAPFPNMWLGAGNQVGPAGRRLSGVETLAMYLVEGLAIVGLWTGWRRFSVWLLWLVATIGMISLGLVVVNVGALYRLRYVFVILLIILAAEGAAQTRHWRRKPRTRGSGAMVADV